MFNVLNLLYNNNNNQFEYRDRITQFYTKNALKIADLIVKIKKFLRSNKWLYLFEFCP